MSLLDGVRVVEMGLWVAGPSAGGMLADWGAEVVKIETPKGDPMRNLYRALSGSEESRCPPFDLYNRGKRSVTLDVNQPEGATLAQKLISTADIFLTNMRPQYLHKVGLHHEQLLAANPKLVYGSLTGYGLHGPDKDAPGYDLAAFSARGGGMPVCVSVPRRNVAGPLSRGVRERRPARPRVHFPTTFHY